MHFVPQPCSDQNYNYDNRKKVFLVHQQKESAPGADSPSLVHKMFNMIKPALLQCETTKKDDKEWVITAWFLDLILNYLLLKLNIKSKVV